MTLLDKFKQIRLFAFDVDGVLTDGSVYLMESGEQVRAMNIKDGFALQLAVKKGYGIVVISGSYSEPVIKRLNKLGITDVFMKVENKLEKLQEYITDKNISLSQVIFVGDDVPDYQVMKNCGLAASPIDAVEEIKSISAYISQYPGGKGCVRDVIEKVLKLNGDWELFTDVKSQ
jgi:3-deoxy-D-manno-octulosonate 8-phosphate phosphatase (KDO 8-P phosphatase)